MAAAAPIPAIQPARKATPLVSPRGDESSSMTAITAGGFRAIPTAAASNSDRFSELISTG